jgi:hypothetical protein
MDRGATLGNRSFSEAQKRTADLSARRRER